MAAWLLWVWLIAVASGCAGGDPEQQLRERIAAAAAAAEERDTGFFRGLIAEGFVDQRGNDRQSILNMVRGQFLIHQRIAVVSRVHQVSLRGEDAAETVLSAGLMGSAGQRLTIRGVSADLYRIELEWIRENGDWRIIGARWSRAGDP